MTEDAADWSEHDLDRRFDLGEPYDELTRLGATLDDLLERIAASLRHEQRFTAELSHELRTPLARIAARPSSRSAASERSDEYRARARRDPAERRPDDAHGRGARRRRAAGGGPRADDERRARGVGCGRRGGTMPPSTGHGAIRVALPTSAVRVAVEAELVERIIQPLLDNAVRYGRSTVARRRSPATAPVARRSTSTTTAPGVAETSASRSSSRACGAARAAPPGGAGLGLALARRLARTAGGDIVARPDPHGGRFSVRLPLA